MDKDKHSISIIMPAFNEEEGLERAVLHNMKTFQELGIDYEIVIINDGSGDRTGEIAEEIAKRYKNVTCYHHKTNRGSGTSFRKGISHSRMEYVMFAPIDNPLDKEDIEAYLPRMDVSDIVVASRVVRVGYNWFARFASFVYNRITVPLLFNIGISDVNWIQIYKRSLFADGIVEFHSSSFFFFVEILVRAREQQLIIVEVPARMKRRLHGKPTHAKFFPVLKVLREMFKFFWVINKEKRKQQ